MNNFTKTPPIKKICPFCHGEKEINQVSTGNRRESSTSYNLMKRIECPKCKGEGEVGNYLTPEEYTKWMRTEGGQPDFKLTDDCPVWEFDEYSGYRLSKMQNAKKRIQYYRSGFFIVAIPGQ